jgi:hypothetical protein
MLFLGGTCALGIRDSTEVEIPDNSVEGLRIDRAKDQARVTLAF